MTARRVPRWTLTRLFVACLAVVTLLVGGLFLVFLESSRRSMLRSAEIVGASAAARVAARVQSDLGRAEHALDDVETGIRHDAIDCMTPSSIEPELFATLLDDPSLAEATFTHAKKLRWDDEGAMVVDAVDRWEVSVFRATADESPILTRKTTREGDGFVAEVRDRPAGAGLLAAPFHRVGPVRDPTLPMTFQTTTSRASYGDAIWADLHWAEADAELPPERRRVVVSVQKTIEDGSGQFVGVLRVALLEQTIDEVARLKVNEKDTLDPHRIFLCDERGRLVTRLSPGDRLAVSDDDLRVAAVDVPASVALALRSPLLASVSAEHPDQAGPLDVHGVSHLVTFHRLPRSQDWIVGIVAPEDYYVHDLRTLRDRSLALFAVVTLLIVGGGLWVLGGVRQGLGRIVDATARMRRFDFAPSSDAATFRDVQEVIDGLERAKTVVRALGKYVPVDLVRELYGENREPTLGGELREVSLMFCDLRGFTELSERLTPDALAVALGHYLETMTSAIASTRGTIDKFIGDAVMAIWNAPGACADHPKAACRAVLACIEATRALYASDAWTGLPPLFTRFGLHTDTVMVGHFGAPTRLSYTALGDGVNLASRLEALCKQYDVGVLVSEAVAERAKDAFVFRLVDAVAVVGKTRAVKVYELLGAQGEAVRGLDVARAYERAFQVYVGRDFRTARALLEAQAHDGPSRVLAERCARYCETPPPADWDGSFHAEHK